MILCLLLISTTPRQHYCFSGKVYYIQFLLQWLAWWQTSILLYSILWILVASSPGLSFFSKILLHLRSLGQKFNLHVRDTLYHCSWLCSVEILIYHLFQQISWEELPSCHYKVSQGLAECLAHCQCTGNVYELWTTNLKNKQPVILPKKNGFLQDWKRLAEQCNLGKASHSEP